MNDQDLYSGASNRQSIEEIEKFAKSKTTTSIKDLFMETINCVVCGKSVTKLRGENKTCGDMNCFNTNYNRNK